MGESKMKTKRWVEFYQKWGILKDEYIWRGNIGPTDNWLEKSSLRYISDLRKLQEEYRDVFEDER